MRKKKRNPQKTLENKCRTLWSKIIRKQADNKCELCAQPHKYLNSHHIIGKRWKPTRFDIMNGIALCPNDHKWAPGLAVHENPMRALRAMGPDKFEYLVNLDLTQPNEYPNTLENIYNKLKEVFENGTYNRDAPKGGATQPKNHRSK